MKSDRSERNKSNTAIVHLKINDKPINNEYVKKLDSDEIKIVPNPEEINKKSEGKFEKEIKSKENEIVSSTIDLQSSEHYDYLEDVDSPISTESNVDDF